MYTRLSSLVLLLAAAGIVLAQGEKTAKLDPSGTWKWERDFNGNKIDYTLRLHCKDGKLTGTYKTVFENGGQPGLSDPVKLDNGKIDGDKILFTVTRKFNDNEFTIAYAGKLADDKITGNTEMDFGNGAREFEWTAKRVVTADDVVGKWKLKFEGQNGPIESKLTLAKDKEGDKLKGTYHSNYFGDNPIMEIAIKDNKLSFVVEIKNDNGEFSIKYRAEPRGDTMTGVMVANFGGQERETPFACAREPEPKDKGAVNDDEDEEDDDEDE